MFNHFLHLNVTIFIDCYIHFSSPNVSSFEFCFNPVSHLTVGGVLHFIHLCMPLSACCIITTMYQTRSTRCRRVNIIKFIKQIYSVFFNKHTCQYEPQFGFCARLKSSSIKFGFSNLFAQALVLVLLGHSGESSKQLFMRSYTK